MTKWFIELSWAIILHVGHIERESVFWRGIIKRKRRINMLQKLLLDDIKGLREIFFSPLYKDLFSYEEKINILNEQRIIKKIQYPSTVLGFVTVQGSGFRGSTFKVHRKPACHCPVCLLSRSLPAIAKHKRAGISGREACAGRSSTCWLTSKHNEGWAVAQTEIPLSGH